LKYYLNTLIKGQSYQDVRETLIDEMKKEGFGLPTEADIKDAYRIKTCKSIKRFDF